MHWFSQPGLALSQLSSKQLPHLFLTCSGVSFSPLVAPDLIPFVAPEILRQDLHGYDEKVII